MPTYSQGLRLLKSASVIIEPAADGRCLTMEHLLHGARRELQKIGRLMDGDPMTHMPRGVYERKV